MNHELSYRSVTGDEILQIHDRLEQDKPGLPGVADPSKAQAIVDRITTLYLYEELPDLWHVAAAYLQAIARSHIFADYNKRTAFISTALFMSRNGLRLKRAGKELEDLTVSAATGEMQRSDIADELKRLTEE